MGAKTLLLAMAYMSCFRWQALLPGVFEANASNHLFAVFIGNDLPSIVLTQYIRMTAAALFVTLRLWTI